MGIRTTLFPIFLAAVLVCGCAGGPEVKPRPVKIGVDFDKTYTGWAGGHSDYTSDTQPNDVVVRPRLLPAPFAGYGLYTAGMNRSDDLFIYIKKKLTGFSPNQDYLVSFSVTFLTDAPAGCIGVGGAPGEAVTLKAGATAIEPETVIVDGQYQMNVDKGSQVQGGKDALALGNIAGTNRDCEQPRFESKTVGSSDALKVRSDEQGAVWLMFGIDCGFEGASEIYYRSATITASLAGIFN